MFKLKQPRGQCSNFQILIHTDCADLGQWISLAIVQRESWGGTLITTRAQRSEISQEGWKWELAAGQSPAFFAQWSIAASGACVALLCHTESRSAFLRQILGHAQRSRMVMCVLPYAAPTLASSFSNSPLRTVLSTPVLCPQTREMLQVQPRTCKTFTLPLSQNVLPLDATELLVRGLCFIFTVRGERR